MGITPGSVGAGFFGDPLDPIVYARHGRELMGWKSPVREPGGFHSNEYYQKYEPKARASPREGV